MKTIFKSLLLAAFIGGIATSANAQTGTTTSTSATARILKQITFAAVDTIQFGTVAAGGGQTFLNPQDQAASTNVGFNSRIGRLVIDATPQEPIRVNFDATVTMRTISNSDSITYEPVISVIHELKTINTTDRAASILISSNAIVAPTTDVTGPTGNGKGPFGLITTTTADDRTTLYLGGSLYQYGTTTAIGSGGPTGTFRGTLNFNVLYAN